MDQSRLVGVLGGTGPAGSGLALRLAAAGHTVLLGSRDSERADARARELRAAWPKAGATITGVANAQAIDSDIVVLATVADSVVATANEHANALAGRVVVSMANLLHRTRRGFAADLPNGTSIAQAVQQRAPLARVVSAYQNLPASALADLSAPLDADVLVCGDDAEAVAAILALTETITNLRAIDGGPLANAAAVEALTAVLLTVNRAWRGEHSVKIVKLN